MISGLVYQVYYTLKDFFNNLFNRKKNILTITNKNDSEEIKVLENELIKMYSLININEIYNDLNNINIYFNKKTNVDKIIEFLEYEAKFIYDNKNNLEIDLSKIKQNMFTINLLEKFKYLEKINKKEKELYILKQEQQSLN